MKFRLQIPTWKHVVHCIFMVSWIWFFTQIAQKRQVEAPDDIFNSYGSVKGLVLLLIRLISLLAFPQTFLNFISLLIFETFQNKVKLRISVQSAPFFVIRIVTRGLYPKLVENNVKRNLDTILSVGCENFAIEGKYGVSHFWGIDKGGFFQKVRLVFQISKSQKKNIPKKFKFQAQDSFLEYFFGDLKKFHCTF